MIAVFVIGAAFIASYIGGIHAPEPHRVPVAIAGPHQATGKVSAALSHNDAFEPRPYPTLAAARRAIEHRHVYGAYAPGQGRLLVTSAFGPATTDFVTGGVRKAASQVGGRLIVHDVAHGSGGDADGLVPFYLVIGWIVSAYLVAAVVGLFRGMAPLSLRDGVVRLAAFAVYSAATGAVGTLIVETGYGYLSGHPWLLTGIGAFCTFATLVATTAAEGLLGIVGTALAILAFVVLGNPSSGGPWPLPFLPHFWRAVGPYLPNWAGTEAVRDVVYFGGHGLLQPLIVFAAYAAGGVVVTLLVSGRSNPAVRFTEAELASG
jgi:hypothetical protein